MSNSDQPTLLLAALNLYQTALNCFDNANNSPHKNEILEIISARDTLEKVLATEKEIPTNIFSKLIELDAKFKAHAYRIQKEEIDLTEYCQSLPTNSQTWLLAIAEAQKSHPWDRFEWLFKFTKIVVWTFVLAIFSTLATRSLSGGSSFFEVALTALPGILSLVQLKKELTKDDKKRFYNLLQSFNGFPEISFPRKIIAIVISSLFAAIFSRYGLLLVFFLLILAKQPLFSDIYKNLGKDFQTKQNLVVAKQKYLKAIALNSNNFDAHFKLATLYEDLQEFELAQKEYIIALKGGYLPAYNNLAYWYIRQGKFLDAISLLDKSWVLVGEQEQSKDFKQLSPEAKLEFRVLKYNLAKNLGWALLETEQYQEIEIWLSAAIGLANNPELKPYVKNPGAAYCLYAKLLEKQDPNSPEIKQQWHECKNLIQSRLGEEQINTEEYQWLYEAKKKLRN